jgi:hypothetical protein
MEKPEIRRPGRVPYSGVRNPAIALFLGWQGDRQESIIDSSLCMYRIRLIIQPLTSYKNIYVHE